MVFKYLKPFMLVLIFAGLSVSVFEVSTAMWETNKSTVISVGLIFSLFWIWLLLDYLDQRVIEKINKIRYDI